MGVQQRKSNKKHVRAQKQEEVEPLPAKPHTTKVVMISIFAGIIIAFAGMKGVDRYQKTKPPAFTFPSFDETGDSLIQEAEGWEPHTVFNRALKIQDDGGVLHDAIELYEIVRRKTVSNPAAVKLYADATGNLGAAYLQLGDLQKAYDILASAVEQGLREKAIFMNLAYIVNEKDDIENAKAFIEEAELAEKGLPSKLVLPNRRKPLSAPEQIPKVTSTVTGKPAARSKPKSSPGPTKTSANQRPSKDSPKDRPPNDSPEDAPYRGSRELKYAVIVPAYAASETDAALLLECLTAIVRSALEVGSELQKSFLGELLVVNDASPGGLFQATWDTFSQLPETQEVNASARFVIRAPVELPENSGAGHARNSGVRLSKGDLLLFCDGDDRWDPGHLSVVLPHFLRDKPPIFVRTAVHVLGAPGDPVHPDWHKALSGTLPSNLAVRRDAHLFFEGFPTHSRYNFGRDMEDIHYAKMLAETEGKLLEEATVGYRWRPGGRLDEQLDKFQQPMGSSHNEIERRHQTPERRWYVTNAMHFTEVFKMYLNGKGYAQYKRLPLPSRPMDAFMQPLMARAPWLDETSDLYGVIPYAGAAMGSWDEVEAATQRAFAMGLGRPRTVYVAPQSEDVLQQGARVWMKFPPGALAQCRTPCVWLQDAEVMNEIDVVLHYCGNVLPPLPEDLPADTYIPHFAYFCAEQLPDRFQEVDLGQYDLTLTQSLSSTIPQLYIPPPAVWKQAMEQYPPLLNPDAGSAQLALFLSNNATNWRFCTAGEEKCWGRLSYLEELMEFISIDSFGSLLHNRDMLEILPTETEAKPTWAKDTPAPVKPFAEGDKVRCIHHGRYPFTLAFENNEEEDYVTEKLYEPLLAGSVPVYWGAPNAAALAPAGSFVDARAVGGPKQLAEHLHALLANPAELEALHAWRSDADEMARVHTLASRSMYLHEVEEVVMTSPSNGEEYTVAGMNNPKKTRTGRVEPYFNPCHICDNLPPPKLAT
ncbi:hypothetical protein CYMTET_31082 [Cymbomonas tetramitiformis]|uniref:Fucosyltransferase n=1 Tax=Cymbomonas tetramitiformis TaxID=36881 RepID=A0AAE0KTB5_9CHLO|nr:hypothetical protein CYMTET_31082 [Cymbomonas tetramitiformis]